jgi:glyoxylase-like metal-dependent hydrolase (beta-lactamase superfamily II)
MLAPGVRWHDDWFAIETIAPGIHAIGEPKYHQINWNYLIEGETVALLFDTGPGQRNIRPVAESLTRLPIIACASHLHYDHTGGLHRFDRIAMADLPILRTCEGDGVFHAPDDLYLGHWEDMIWTPLHITDWWPVGEPVDLGNRNLDLLATPGHSPDSVSLFDQSANILFAADFVYPGALYAQVPGASLDDYLATAESLLTCLDAGSVILCAHGQPDGTGRHAAPRLSRSDVADLAASLATLRASGARPTEHRINARLTLIANDAAFAAWQSPK